MTFTFRPSSLSFSSTKVFTIDTETELTAKQEFQTLVIIIFIDISCHHWHRDWAYSLPSRSFRASSLSFSLTSVFTTDTEAKFTAKQCQSLVIIIFIDISVHHWHGDWAHSLVGVSEPRHYHFHWHQWSPLTPRLSSQPNSFRPSSLSFTLTSVFTTDTETELTAYLAGVSEPRHYHSDWHSVFTTDTETEFTA